MPHTMVELTWCEYGTSAPSLHSGDEHSGHSRDGRPSRVWIGGAAAAPAAGEEMPAEAAAPPVPAAGDGVGGAPVEGGDGPSGAVRTISPSGVMVVRRGGPPSGYAEGGAVGAPCGTGTQIGVLSEAMPAWSEMCSNGTEGSAWRAKKVVRKRLRRVDHRAGEYISWRWGPTDQQRLLARELTGAYSLGTPDTSCLAGMPRGPWRG